MAADTDCKFCDKKLGTYAALVNHHANKHKERERPKLKCPICRQRSDELPKHAVQHGVDMPIAKKIVQQD